MLTVTFLMTALIAVFASSALVGRNTQAPKAA